MTNVAMLIDWENIKACSLEFLRTPPDIITLKKIARAYGSLRIARAYANWTDASGWHTGDAERLNSQGIEPVFVSTRYFQSGQYEKDLVDLRIACDGMELLAQHPEIDSFVVVSGDGALETLLSKLSANGKRVVRVAVEKSLGRGVHVLGEERVIYDDWVKGFQFSRDERVADAAKALADAVRHIAQTGGDVGLHAVKEQMRRTNPDFEEERLGIPTFRHLAYVAEAIGLIRVDARREPAQAYPADMDRTPDNAFLPTGEMWKAFITGLDPRMDYDKFGIESSFAENVPDYGDLSLEEMRNLAVQSDVMSRVSSKHVTRDQKTWHVNVARLNPHHPRVQVVLAGA